MKNYKRIIFIAVLIIVLVFAFIVLCKCRKKENFEEYTTVNEYKKINNFTNHILTLMITLLKMFRYFKKAIF